ncbi:MAG TPA: hypothetical protein VFC19_18975 [Candidatus Limnocylindrales bacterium]|nr:hypothetical protein [Candidatus Limnocylindrales bacterium]
MPCRSFYGRGCALIEQDYLRRIILREHDGNASSGIAPGFIVNAARFALGHGYHVVLEGILATLRYGEALRGLIDCHAGAVDQTDPAASVVWVAGFGLVEQRGDHRRDRVFQRGVDLAATGFRAGPACGSFAGVDRQDVGGVARSRGSVVEGSHHRHAAAPAAFPP